jgi:hypothetical protein
MSIVRSTYRERTAWGRAGSPRDTESMSYNPPVDEVKQLNGAKAYTP